MGIVDTGIVSGLPRGIGHCSNFSHSLLPGFRVSVEGRENSCMWVFVASGVPRVGNWPLLIWTHRRGITMDLQWERVSGKG